MDADQFGWFRRNLSTEAAIGVAAGGLVYQLRRIPTTIAVVGLVLGYIGYGMVHSRVHEMYQQIRKACAA